MKMLAIFSTVASIGFAGMVFAEQPADKPTINDKGISCNTTGGTLKNFGQITQVNKDLGLNSPKEAGEALGFENPAKDYVKLLLNDACGVGQAPD